MASMAKETSLQTAEISSKEQNTSPHATGIPPLIESSPLMSSFVDVLRRMPDNGQPDALAPLDQSKHLGKERGIDASNLFH
ncbi:hypothetical protein DFH09DRAFT_1308759 [Mycena vulgaris]|nr:hypothetical protein DFH09DRAFT_1308759 [Mycena vulgaris]